MHKSVLLNEAINLLNINKNNVYVDCTLGLGGHSAEILKRLNGSGILIGIEQDESILEIAKDNLKNFRNCYLFHANFLQLPEILQTLKIGKISGGILLDLGVNSIHFDKSERGFSFKSAGPLDMRMDTSQPLTAYKIINTYKEPDLADIIYKYGEERHARKIAKAIIHNRSKAPIQTTGELANIIFNCYRYITNRSYFKTNPATKTFQALRIEVNKELENLEKFLCFIPELLFPHSRLIVISFHSLEDRITKNFLKNNREFKILTKKPITPSSDEIKSNPRSRSAKLRAAEKNINEILFKNNKQ